MSTALSAKKRWRVLSSEEHKLGRYTLKIDEVESPDASRRIRWVYHAGSHAVATLAVDDDGRAVLVREYRHPLGCEVLNIPAGSASGASSEDDLQRQAANELAEEAGVTARCWQKIGAYHPLPGFSALTMHLYLATELDEVTERGDGDEWREVEEVVRIPLAELYQDVVAGVCTDSPTMTAVLWAVARGMVVVGVRSVG
ncbi:MAG: NUDIX domain-containing protein [Armatimonadota bacterium]